MVLERFHRWIGRRWREALDQTTPDRNEVGRLASAQSSMIEKIDGVRQMRRRKIELIKLMKIETWMIFGEEAHAV